MILAYLELERKGVGSLPGIEKCLISSANLGLSRLGSRVRGTCLPLHPSFYSNTGLDRLESVVKGTCIPLLSANAALGFLLNGVEGPLFLRFSSRVDTGLGFGRLVREGKGSYSPLYFSPRENFMPGLGGLLREEKGTSSLVRNRITRGTSKNLEASLT
jgi:hypothetical protein